MPVTSIFSNFHNVFYYIKYKNTFIIATSDFLSANAVSLGKSTILPFCKHFDDLNVVYCTLFLAGKCVEVKISFTSISFIYGMVIMS